MGKDTDLNKGEPRRQDSPVEFMRARHPDLYSDSVILKQPLLSKQLFDYHLETLTSRSQETEFANFCRRLAEKEICPNLRPQTGPTGGGDSKADSETVPVSSEVSVRWIGVDPKAGQERWAFAFSAKKKWKDKAKSDVESIISTNRPYAKVYFITNQYARDKDRSGLEDELTGRYGVPVTILDRSWIMQAIFDHDRVSLAVDTLHIDEASLQIKKDIGPNDFQRTKKLRELEDAIADTDRYVGAHYQLAEDCLSAALLARGLQKHRSELDGYFIRASQIAEEVGNPKQRLRVIYNYAWTAIFWYDDYLLFNSLYDAVEALVKGSDQASDTERLLNLYQVLISTTRRGVLGAAEAKVEQRRIALAAELGRQTAEDTRPNNALQARTCLALLSLIDALFSESESQIEDVWGRFTNIVEDAKHLGDYPFEPFVKLIETLADLGMEGTRFEELFENVVLLLEARRGEGVGGEALLQRGFQKLENGQYYEAIRFFGRAQDRFIKREYRQELIFSLAGASGAYERAGLYWAARNNALACLERCLAYFHEDGTLVRPVLPSIKSLLYSELRLGRVPQLMSCFQLFDVVAGQMNIGNKIRRKRVSSVASMKVCSGFCC
jgi:hypothetical protein